MPKKSDTSPHTPGEQDKTRKPSGGGEFCSPSLPLLDLLLENLDCQVWFLKSPTHYGEVNHAHAAFLGKRSEEVRNRLIADVVRPEDLALWTRDNDNLFSTGARHYTEEKIKDATGKNRVLIISRTPMAGADGSVTCVACSAVDVTGERECLRKLEEARRNAAAATFAKRDFLANISHEIRTPLNGVIGIAEILATIPATPEQLRYLKILDNEARNILELVNGILDFSKITAGRMELERVPFNLSDLLTKFGESMAVRAEKAGINFILDLDPDLPTELLGDPVRLRQIFTNLVGNAIKFTREGHVTLLVRRNGDLTTFEVIDTGVGIPAGREESLFAQFEQIDGSTTRNFGGTGLGGAIARNLVRLMGSDISVRSVEGIGTTLKFELHLPPAVPGDAPNPFKEYRKKTLQGTVLVVDDNDVNRQVVMHLLQRIGLKAKESSSGPEALALFQESQFSLVLLDMSMPGMDGAETCKRIREMEDEEGAGGHTPVIALSGTEGSALRIAAKAAGMDDYLVKPVRANELFEKLSMWLGDGVSQKTLEGGGEDEDQERDGSANVLDFDTFAGSMGDKSLAASICAEFLRRLPAQVEKLEKALLNGDWKKLTGEAHGLRGSAANIFAERLSLAAANIESLAEREVSQRGEKALNALKEEIETLREVLPGVSGE